MKKIKIVIIMLFFTSLSFAQVISNSINISNFGTIISSGDIVNNGTISNSGYITTSNYTNIGTINGSGIYNINGNWINSGIFNSENSTVNFVGSSLQNISGLSPSSFNNITINGYGISVSQNINFTNLLTINNGIISGNDTVTLVSNSLYNAKIAQVGSSINSSSITAMFTIQNYENVRTEANYICLSSPVGNTINEMYNENQIGTVGDWNVTNRTPTFYMSGVGGPDGNAASYISVYKYNEVTYSYIPITTYASPGIKYNIIPGNALYLWLGTNLSTITNPFSYNTHGIPNVGSFNVSVTKTSGKGNGFNILGNPYACPISWTSFLSLNPTLQTSYYILEQDGTWHTFTSGNIAMGEGFGIVTNSPSVITFAESLKILTNTPMLKPDDGDINFRLYTKYDDFGCNTTIEPGGDSNYSSYEDAFFIESYIKSAPEMYTISADSNNLSLNKTTQTSIPLEINVNQDSDYILKMESNNTIYNCILLTDGENILNNFSLNNEYDFKNNFKFKKLYYLKFENNYHQYNSDSVTIFKNTNNDIIIKFNLDKIENNKILIYNMIGQCVKSINYVTQDGILTIPLHMSENLYIVKVETNYDDYCKKISYIK